MHLYFSGRAVNPDTVYAFPGLRTSRVLANIQRLDDASQFGSQISRVEELGRLPLVSAQRHPPV